MKISVCEGTNYKTCVLDIDARTTVEDVKLVIEVELGIAVHEQKLVYNG